MLLQLLPKTISTLQLVLNLVYGFLFVLYYLFLDYLIITKWHISVCSFRDLALLLARSLTR